MARTWKWFPLWLSTFDSYINDLPAAQFKAAVYLFSLARPWPKQRMVGGDLVELQPGQILTTVRKLAEGANVSRGAVERALANLAKGRTIEIEPRRGGTIITLLSYSEFRLGDTETQDTNEVTVETSVRQERVPRQDTPGPRNGTPGETRSETRSETPPTPPYKEVRERRETGESESIARAREGLSALGETARRLGPKPPPTGERSRQALELWRHYLAELERAKPTLKGFRSPGLSEHPIAKLLAEGVEADAIRHAIDCYVAEAMATGNPRWVNPSTLFQRAQVERVSTVTVEAYVQSVRKKAANSGDQRRFYEHTGAEDYAGGKVQI